MDLLVWSFCPRHVCVSLCSDCLVFSSGDDVTKSLSQQGCFCTRDAFDGPVGMVFLSSPCMC
jgi:hypothetical protein